MRQFILSAILVFGLCNSSITQVTHAPVANTPKVTIPATMQGRTQLIDSFKRKNFSAGKVMKIFMPQYSAEFQDELIQDIRLMANTGFTYTELVQGMKAEYPGITYGIATKIFFNVAHQRGWKTTVVDQWAMQQLLGTTYASQERSTVKILKGVGMQANDIFNFFEDVLYGTIGTDRQNLAVNHLSEYPKAGFTADQTYQAIKAKAVLVLSAWIPVYCKAMKLANVDAVSVAKALKPDYPEHQISTQLKAAGYPANEVLAALQAL